MKRKPALAVAATAAMVGAAGIVTAAALTRVNILGFHVGAPRAEAASVVTASTGPPVADDAPPQTLAPAVVLQTEYVDQIVTISVPAAAAVAAPAAYSPSGAQAPGAGTDPPPAVPAPAVPAAPATAPVTTPAPVATTPAPVATTPAPTTPAPTAAPTTPAPTSAPTLAPTTTAPFNSAAYPFKISIPSDWGSKPVPAPPTPIAGRQWKACELHDAGWWECEYA